jgi:signal transduction histidine kinase
MSSQSINQEFLQKASLNKVKLTDKLTKILIFLRLRIMESTPFVLACIVLLTVISLKSPVLLFCLLIGSLITIVIQQIGQQINLPKSQLIPLQILAVVTLLSIFWLDYFAAPAQAQFFKRAEDFFQNTLTQGASSGENTQLAVGLVFNVLRALYLLYIAVALIGVVNAVRKDEDWQNIARTPLLVVVAVTIADVLTGFVIGSGNK